jgi:transcriptional regulator with XRE-family HTH domain
MLHSADKLASTIDMAGGEHGMAVSQTVRRRALGARLRELRRAANLTLVEAAEFIESTDATISKLETGKAKLKQVLLRELLVNYGCEPDEITKLLHDSREADTQGWWAQFNPPPVLETYLDLETDASLVRTYELDVMPGLLQTEDYARVLELTEKAVELRMARQRRLTDDESGQRLRYWAVIDEQVLRRPVGPASLMREQLEHIAEVARLPNATIQVMPTRRGYHLGLRGSFSILTLPDPSAPDVGFTESAVGNIYVEKAWQVATLIDRYDMLRADALPPEDSMKLVLEIAKVHWKS